MVAKHWHPSPLPQKQAAPGTPASSLLQFLRYEERKKKVRVKAEVKGGMS